MAGLLEKRARAQEESKALTASAFGDLSALATHARAVVRLAEQYAAEAARAGDAAVAAPGADAAGLLLNLGVANPVTKAAAGGLYYAEVARQLATF